MPLIELRHIDKTYQLGDVDLPVLKDVTLSIERGEFVALMGASGSGKTTLMNLLGCLDRPTAGSYRLDGVEVTRLDPTQLAQLRGSRIGFVFQNFNLLPRATALENVRMPTAYSTNTFANGHLLLRSQRLLETVGLASRTDHSPSKLSGGEQQRVAIARSLVNQPMLLLADEPTGNLDSRTGKEILEIFRELNVEKGITILLVTHDADVAHHADRVVRIADGKIVEDSRPADIILPSPDQPSVGARRGARGEGCGVGIMDNTRFCDNTGPHSNPLPKGEGTICDNTGPHPNPLPKGEGTIRDDTGPHPNPLRAPTEGWSGEGTILEHPLGQANSGTPVESILRGRKRNGLRLAMDATRMALQALQRNVMRTALTMLGVIIGVAAVIAMMEISNGASVAIQVTVTNMGANTLLVLPGAPQRGTASFGLKTETITPEDAEAIARECPSVVCTAPIVEAYDVQVVYGNRSWSPIYVTGSTNDFLQARNWTDLDLGRMFNERELLSSSKVCLIGKTLVRELFGARYPIGQEIRVKNVPFTVIGVLSEKGANLLGVDQDDILLAPWTTVKYRISGGDSEGPPIREALHALPGIPLALRLPGSQRGVRTESVHAIMVKAASPEAIPKATKELTQLLHERHNLAKDETDFRIYDMAEVSNALKKTIHMLSGLGMSIAAVSLLVGGVGIMNIMLVSVTERTREIGLRMAVGADAKDILRQFLIEAVVLCMVGGFIGILAGRAASWFSGTVMGWPTHASPSAAAVAVAVSVTIGITFGYYPAWRASRLNPIDALRYE